MRGGMGDPSNDRSLRDSPLPSCRCAAIHLPHQGEGGLSPLPLHLKGFSYMWKMAGFVPFFPVSGKTFIIPHPQVMRLPKNGLPRLLRDTRLERKLSKREVAQKIGVVAEVIGKWERGEHVPRVHYMLAILNFLGDDTWLPDRSFADRLFKFRARHGWSQAKLAGFVGYDERSVARWEAGDSAARKTQELIEGIISSRSRPTTV